MKRLLIALATAFVPLVCFAQAPHVPLLEQDNLEAPKLLEKLATQATPDAFVQELYRELQQQPMPDAFSGGKDASHIYANPLLSSVHKEFWGSTHSFAGQLDYTPLCVCKDPAGFTLSSIAYTSVDKSHTDATFTLHFVPPAPNPSTEKQTNNQAQAANDTLAFPGEPAASEDQPVVPPPDRHMILRLVHGEHGWRVDDIASNEVPSMKLMLQQRHPEPSAEAASIPPTSKP